MNITTRDLEVVNYLDKGFLLTSTIASDLVYHTTNQQSSLRIAQRRMSILYKEKQIKRVRDSITNEYIYYSYHSKIPTKTTHRLKISEFVSKLNTIGFQILDVILEYSELQEEYHIRPDIYIVLEYFGKKISMLIEVDLTKPFSNIDAYNQLITDRRNGKSLPLEDLPLLICSVSDKPIDKTKCIFKPLLIKTDFSNIENTKIPFIK